MCIVLTTLNRYSEFDRLRENLVKAFPHAEGSIPQLPRKSVVSRFRPRFLEQRKNGLSHFIRYVVEHMYSNDNANLPRLKLAASYSTLSFLLRLF